MFNRINNTLKQNTICEFTENASTYDASERYSMVQEDYMDVIEEVEKEEFTTLLDCGCGTGKLIEIMASRQSGKAYRGVDITPAMIDEAEKKRIKNAMFYVGDSEKLEEILSDDEGFDVITCVHSFHHYPKPLLFLKSAYSVLANNGRVIIRDNARKNILSYLITNVIVFPIIGRFFYKSGDVHCYTPNEIKQLCEKSGFNLEKVTVIDGRKLHCVLRKTNV